MVGFLAGLGFLNYPFARIAGRPATSTTTTTEDPRGWTRYIGYSTDHKVVGLQYLIGIGFFIFFGGVNAMLIRFELLRPQPNVFGSGQYLTLVGLHGTMMMGMMTSGILGPFGSYFLPLMIGARRLAFPRIEALTFWLLMAGGLILSSTVFYGGFPTGWTGYAPLNDQANMGMDAYIAFFALVGISMTLLALQHAGDRVHDAGARAHLGPAPDLRLEHRRDRRAQRPRRAGADHDPGDGRARPDGADRLLPLDPGGQPVPLREPVLVLRAPRGVHPRDPGLRDRARAPARVLAQAAVGLPARRSPGCSASPC